MTAAGDMLATAIKRSGHSQNSIARAIEVDSSNINKMCKGMQPVPLYVAIRLEKFLDMTAESLLVTQLYDQIRDAREDERQGRTVAHRNWTAEEDAALLELTGTLEEIAEQLGRSRMAVAQRRRRLLEKADASAS